MLTQLTPRCWKNVVKLLFLWKRAWPEIQTSVTFLCTRVEEPWYGWLPKVDENDEVSAWNNKKLATNSQGPWKWFNQLVDQWVFCYALGYEESHGWGDVPPKGSVFGTSTCQKLNTRALWKRNWSEWMMSCHRSHGHKTFSKPKDMGLQTMSYSNTMRVQCFLRQMGSSPAASGLGTSTEDTSLYRDWLDWGWGAMCWVLSNWRDKLLVNFFTKLLQGTSFQKVPRLYPKCEWTGPKTTSCRQYGWWVPGQQAIASQECDEEQWWAEQATWRWRWG